MVWLILLAILTLLAVLLCILPIGVNVVYDANGLQVAAFAGVIRFRLYQDFAGKDVFDFISWGKRKNRRKKTGRTKDDKQPTAGGRYQTFLTYAQFVVDFLFDFRRKLVIKELELRMVLASSDPYDLAMRYGSAWTAVGNLAALLEQAFTIKKRDLSVDHDFLGDQTRFFAKLHASVKLGQIIILGAKYVKRYFTKINKLSITKKGGASK